MDRVWGGGICCSVVVLCVRVPVSYREVVLCCQKVGGRFEVDSSLSLHMFGKAWVPLVDGQGNAGNPRSPQQPPVVSQSHLASPACGWVRACLVRLLLPLPARVSVCQCVSDASAETNLYPCREAISGFPPASARPAFNCLSLHPHFVKPIRPSGPPWRITQSA